MKDQVEVDLETKESGGMIQEEEMMTKGKSKDTGAQETITEKQSKGWRKK